MTLLIIVAVGLIGFSLKKVYVSDNRSQFV